MVECQIVALDVVGSIPISHPIFFFLRVARAALGRRQAVRHGTLTPARAGSNPTAPAIFSFWLDPLAQSVEHLTFNQGVRGSNPRWVTSVFKSELFILHVKDVFGFIIEVTE